MIAYVIGNIPFIYAYIWIIKILIDIVLYELATDHKNNSEYTYSLGVNPDPTLVCMVYFQATLTG